MTASEEEKMNHACPPQPATNGRRGVHGGLRRLTPKMDFPVLSVLRGSILSWFVMALFLNGCSEEFESQPRVNLPPETYLAVDTVGTTVTSRVQVHWWGDDPDGLVQGFLVSWDGTNWTYTKSYDSLFTLDLVGAVTIVAQFQVSAIDVEGNGRYDRDISVGGISFGDEPFIDANGTGQYEPDEPFVDYGAIDATPAGVQYLVKNTPPEIAFQFGSEVPAITLPVASFILEGTDVDGDETIAYYYISLNDTTRWVRIPGSVSLLTLVGDLDDLPRPEVSARALAGDRLEDIGVSVPGLRLDATNVLYAYAEDLAGAVSDTVRMPGPPKTWFVKQPRGRRKLLLIDDFSGGTPNPDQKYSDILQQVPDNEGQTFGDYDFLDIKTSPVPAGIARTFLVETMRQYRIVFWYADRAPNLNFAQNTIPQYLESSGKLIFSTGFVNFTDNRGIALDFAPIDSLLTLLVDSTGAVKNGFVSRVFQGSRIVSTDSTEYPHLYIELTTQAGVGIYGVEPSPPPARVLYQLDRPKSGETWVGTPPVCVLGSKGDIVFMTVPFHLLNGTDPVGQSHLVELFEKILRQQFGQ